MNDLPKASQPIQGRQCGTCTLCCKLMKVDELEKPMGTWCRHCRPGVGCGIYETRPNVCRAYHCGYLQSAEVSDAWYPARSWIILNPEEIGIVAYVDPGRPTAWMAEPYYSDLKSWARGQLANQRQVIVRVGRRQIAILPDRDVDLGIVGDDEEIVVERTNSAAGARYDVHKWKRV